MTAAARRLIRRWAETAARRAAGTVDLSVLRDGLRRTMVTPGCGLALVDRGRAERTAAQVRDVSAVVRRMVLDDLAPAATALSSTTATGD